MKRCTRCQEMLHITEFVRNRNLPDGYTAHCKMCHRLDQRYPANPWRALLASARRRAARSGERLDFSARDLPPRVPRCPLTGDPPTLLCRIDPDIGWTPENVIGLSGWAARLGSLDISLGKIQEFIKEMDRQAP